MHHMSHSLWSSWLNLLWLWIGAINFISIIVIYFIIWCILVKDASFRNPKFHWVKYIVTSTFDNSWQWHKFSAVLNQRSSSFRRLRMNSARVVSLSDECSLSWLYSLRYLASLSCASSCGRNQWKFTQTASINGLSVGFSGREKYSVTPCPYSYLPRLFEINSLPLSVWIRIGKYLFSTRIPSIMLTTFSPFSYIPAWLAWHSRLKISTTVTAMKSILQHWLMCVRPERCWWSTALKCLRERFLRRFSPTGQ